MPFICIHSVNLTAAFHNRNFSYYDIIMPAWTKQYLILYFSELNNRMNLSNRNDMFRKSFIFYFLLLQKLAFLPYDLKKYLKYKYKYSKNVFKYSIYIQILMYLPQPWHTYHSLYANSMLTWICSCLHGLPRLLSAATYSEQ